MTEPWFNPNQFAWIPGTLFGVLGGTWGALVGTLAPRGKARSLVLGAWVVLLVACALCLITGIAGILTGQPYGVWYGLLLPGVLGVILLSSLGPVARNAYRLAEARKMQARDLLDV